MVGCSYAVVVVLLLFAVSESSSLDIVRELCFISGDGGLTWRAEVYLILV